MAKITNEFIIQKLSTQFGENIVQSSQPFQLLTVTVDCASIIDVLRFLKEDVELQFQFLTDITAIHLPEQTQIFAVVYHLHSFRNQVRLRLKTFLNNEKPQIASATVLWKGANWMERETYDFFGIVFEGHPDLRRILNVDEMTVFPMRREYPLEDPNRVDKKDEFFGR